MDKQLANNGRLNHKIAIVTGGASGIGKGICLEFASHGASVIVADKNIDGAESVAREIEKQGGSGSASQVDVCLRQKVQETVLKTLDQYGTIDILVNCAGINIFRPAEKFTDEEWKAIRSVNLDGPWNFCQAVIYEMKKKQSGKIINIGSGSALRATPNAAPYVTTKHGLAGLTKALAVDLGPYNINVNCICPASVDTPLLREGTSPEYRKAITMRIPLGRLGKVSDIAKAALFLSSSDADWITGEILSVDGGLNCCSFVQHIE